MFSEKKGRESVLSVLNEYCALYHTSRLLDPARILKKSLPFRRLNINNLIKRRQQVH
ncbi:MAG TPA: hypothetical protein VE572_01000 [Nitrososphaeraceae archaeon]|nr:hypothetical protein [Nitrososphaeraceae archaeon]